MKNLSEERGEEREREGKQGKVGEARKSDAARLMVITPLPFVEGLGGEAVLPSSLSLRFAQLFHYGFDLPWREGFV